MTTTLHTVTPLVYSEALSSSSGHNIFLKLETEQLSGSFKPRGIGAACQDAVRRLGKDVHIVVASGGNAALAAAISTQTLGVKCTVFCHATTEQLILDKLASHGANIEVAEGGWEFVDAGARNLAKTDPYAEYIHPFEGDALVRGHTSVIDEIYDQLPKVAEARGINATRPDAVCSAVGGGGMIRGIMLGLTEHAQQDKTDPVHVIGIATLGADAWGRSLETDDELVSIDDFSRAKSLGCKQCSGLSVRDARIYAATGKTTLNPTPITGRAGKYLSEVRIDDAIAGSAAWQATEELNHLIEISCGAAMAVAQYPEILDHIVTKKNLPSKLNVVVIVCGGSRVNLKMVEEFKESYGNGYGKVIIDGEEIMDIAK